MAKRTRLFERYVDTGIMSMAELSRVSGYRHEHLSRVRHGRLPITPGFVARMCLALHAPESVLFYDDEEAGTVAARDRASA